MASTAGLAEDMCSRAICEFDNLCTTYEHEAVQLEIGGVQIWPRLQETREFAHTTYLNIAHLANLGEGRQQRWSGPPKDYLHTRFSTGNNHHRGQWSTHYSSSLSSE